MAITIAFKRGGMKVYRGDQSAQIPGKTLVVRSEEQLAGEDQERLLTIWNALTGRRTKGFHSKRAGAAQVWDLLRQEAEGAGAHSPKRRVVRVGRREREESETVAQVIERLRKGATKAEISQGVPGATPHYVHALVHRILPEKGYRLTRYRPNRSKAVVYQLAA